MQAMTNVVVTGSAANDLGGLPAYGSKVQATAGLNAVELAKIVRADIKAMIASGLLPAAKYSVTSSRNSMDVRAALPFATLAAEFYKVECSWITFDSFQPAVNGAQPHRHTMAARLVLATLEAIVGAYHWDKSDSQSDYFHSRFYKSVELDNAAEHRALEASMLADAAHERKNAAEKLEMLADDLAELDTQLPAPAACVAATGWL